MSDDFNTLSIYSQLPLAAIFGFFLLGQLLKIWFIPVAALIIRCRYYPPLSEVRRRRAQNEAERKA